MGEGECETLPEERPKKSRHRKKNLYNKILQQMEFYFGDSNLAKDRFLFQLLSESSYIDIEVFFTFNNIKKLNCTKEDIQKAIRKSDLIGVSEDGLKIYRKKPMRLKENVDFCTIYVENIKADANHENLSQIFSDFGNVVYVSIPKYKNNKGNKGFAFIEYETDKQADDAISFFESIGCKIPSQKNPEELQSIVTFQGDQPDIETDGIQNTVIEESENTDENEKKRKLSVEGGEGGSVDKKPKTDNDDHTDTKDEKLTETEEDGNKKQEDKDDGNKKKEGEEDENQIDEQEDSKKKKKNKKEKRKNYIKELGMQVLSKKEWKKLRNHYLDLQRKKMKEFKQYLHRQKFASKHYKKDNEEILEESKEPEEPIEEVTKLGYTPGVIVKLRLPEPCIDVKKLKNEIKAISPEVKYVDIPLPAGSEEVFVRFGTKTAASDFCTEEFIGEKSVLSGDEERSYWEKIETDRAVKFRKQAKKLRGREKLLKRAERISTNHLRFEEIE